MVPRSSGSRFSRCGGSGRPVCGSGAAGHRVQVVRIVEGVEVQVGRPVVGWGGRVDIGRRVGRLPGRVGWDRGAGGDRVGRLPPIGWDGWPSSRGRAGASLRSGRLRRYPRSASDTLRVTGSAGPLPNPLDPLGSI